MWMPFGKFKGEEIHDIPRDYLIWVLSNITLTQPGLEEEIRRVLGWGRSRSQQSAPTPPPPPPPSGRDARAVLEKAKASVLDAVKKWHRKQAVRNHPDRGGDTRVMQVVNTVADDLTRDITTVFDVMAAEV